MIVHFHGGLVSKATAMKAINSHLLTTYNTNYSRPIFFIWESGIFDVLKNNLDDIFSEKIFKILLKKVTKVLSAKFNKETTEKGLRSTNDGMYNNEFSKISIDEYPFDQLDNISDSIELLNPAEENLIEQNLLRDLELLREISSISSSISEVPVKKGIKMQGSAKTLMNHEYLATDEKGQKGIISTAKVALSVIQILQKVIARLKNHTHHGVYATIIEELLREFYVGNIGKFVWDEMKNYIKESFNDDPELYGGTAFLTELKERWKDGYKPEITLVGHSAGSYAIGYLLKAADKMELPPEIKFNLILLAPACSFIFLNDIINNHESRINKLRCFGMKDAVEKKDKMLSIIYPHSLLYFVSGLLEDEVDKPLVGMERYYTRNTTDVQAVKAYFNQTQNSNIWSIAGNLDGLSSSSFKHGDFDNDDITLKSIMHIVEKGY